MLVPVGNLIRLATEAESRNASTEAQHRASELRTDFEFRKVHPDVLRFCKKELLKDNYFHAVFEATKSVADKLRAMSGLTYASDEHRLV